MSAASSFTGHKQRSNQSQNKRRGRVEGQTSGGENPDTHKGIPPEVSEALADSVSRMGMDPDLPDLNDNPIPASLERVSGLNSFMGSSDATGISITDAIPISHLSMRDRLMMSKSSREGPSGEKKSHVEVKGAAKDIEKPKRGKKVTPLWQHP